MLPGRGKGGQYSVAWSGILAPEQPAYNVKNTTLSITILDAECSYAGCRTFNVTLIAVSQGVIILIVVVSVSLPVSSTAHDPTCTAKLTKSHLQLRS
jgi:hypothetical protein